MISLPPAQCSFSTGPDHAAQGPLRGSLKAGEIKFRFLPLDCLLKTSPGYRFAFFRSSLPTFFSHGLRTGLPPIGPPPFSLQDHRPNVLPTAPPSTGRRFPLGLIFYDLLTLSRAVTHSIFSFVPTLGSGVSPSPLLSVMCKLAIRHQFSLR